MSNSGWGKTLEVGKSLFSINNPPGGQYNYTGADPNEVVIDSKLKINAQAIKPLSLEVYQHEVVPFELHLSPINSGNELIQRLSQNHIKATAFVNGPKGGSPPCKQYIDLAPGKGMDGGIFPFSGEWWVECEPQSITDPLAVTYYFDVSDNTKLRANYPAKETLSLLVYPVTSDFQCQITDTPAELRPFRRGTDEYFLTETIKPILSLKTPEKLSGMESLTYYLGDKTIKDGESLLLTEKELGTHVLTAEAVMRGGYSSERRILRFEKEITIRPAPFKLNGLPMGGYLALVPAWFNLPCGQGVPEAIEVPFGYTSTVEDADLWVDLFSENFETGAATVRLEKGTHSFTIPIRPKEKLNPGTYSYSMRFHSNQYFRPGANITVERELIIKSPWACIAGLALFIIAFLYLVLLVLQILKWRILFGKKFGFDKDRTFAQPDGLGWKFPLHYFPFPRRLEVYDGCATVHLCLWPLWSIRFKVKSEKDMFPVFVAPLAGCAEVRNCNELVDDQSKTSVLKVTKDAYQIGSFIFSINYSNGQKITVQL